MPSKSMDRRLFISPIVLIYSTLIALYIGGCTTKITVPALPVPPFPMTSTPTPLPTFTFTATPNASSTNTPTVLAASSATFSATPSSTPTATYSPATTLTPVPSATATTLSTATSTPNSFDLSSGVTTLNSGLYQYSCFHLGPGGTVTINGGVTILTGCFTLDAGATITGMGEGHHGGINDWGPGIGGVTVAPVTISCGTCPPGLVGFGGGGGHGGAGGNLCDLTYCANGGIANDDPVHPSLLGSVGGNYSDSAYYPNSGSGGGLLDVIVYDLASNTVAPATVNGTIDMSGAAGGTDYVTDQYSGGGAGGAIVIETSVLSGTGLLQANGGEATYSGGGGGGIISFIENSTSFPGTTSVTGGYPIANSGSVTFTHPPLTGY